MANRQRLGVQIINLSLGHPIFTAAGNDPLVQAVERASAAGLIVVASSGNFGQNTTTGQVGYAGTTSPGNAPSAITVGAVNTFDTNERSDDVITSYSSRGPTRSYWTDAAGVKHYDNLVKPDLAAPGNKLTRSSVPATSARSHRPG